jgi:uncharacterized membrane protein YgcG
VVGANNAKEGVVSEVKDKPFLLKDFKDDNLAGALDQHLDEIKQHTNTRIDYDKSYSVETPATPGQEFKVVHKLGYIPHRFLVIGQNALGTIYRSTGAWTDQAAYFKSDAVGMEAEILIW